MKLPRGLSGSELARKLSSFGYGVTRQTGSHLRLTTQLLGEHHITIPNHASSLRIGTLSSILSEVAAHLEITKEDLVTRLFH